MAGAQSIHASEPCLLPFHTPLLTQTRRLRYATSRQIRHSRATTTYAPQPHKRYMACLLRRHRTQHRPRNPQTNYTSHPRWGQLQNLRPEDMDLLCASRKQDDPPRTHHTSRGSQETIRGTVVVLHRFRSPAAWFGTQEN